jgi:hypothetical protein
MEAARNSDLMQKGSTKLTATMNATEGKARRMAATLGNSKEHLDAMRDKSLAVRDA